MDLNLLANIKNIPAIHSLFGVQEEAQNATIDYQNNNSGLRNAQKIADNRMSQNKTKMPMLIEYYQSKGQRSSVELYINPARLTMQNQKIKAKAVTRGGIFYHHWGDDHWAMSISGTTGFSGMKGIEQLENLYAYSGTIMRYQNTAAPRHSGSMDLLGDEGLLGMLKGGDLSGALNYVMNHNLKDELVKTAKGAIQDKINGYITSKITDPLAAQLRSGNTATKSSNAIVNTMANIVGFAKKATGYQDPNDQNAKNSFNFGSVAGMAIRGLIGEKIGLVDKPSSQVADWGQAQRGWSDINDELTDEWRPRVMWIFFEDRVYIGTFDSFNYQRVAETPLINYEMRFTVYRQVIVDCFNPIVPEFQPSSLSYAGNSGKVAKSIAASRSQTLKANSLVASAIVNGLPTETWQTQIKRFEAKTPEAIAEAKAEILKTKEDYLHEKEINELNGTKISDQRTSQVNNWLKQVRDSINILATDTLYGEINLTQDQRLYYYSLAKEGNSIVTSSPKFNNKNALNAAKLEIGYIKSKYLKLSQLKQLTPSKAKEMVDWLQQVHDTSGIATIESWETDLKKLIPTS
jgi:hypothetical protein